VELKVSKNIPEKYYVPFVTALWMIVLPAVFWFFGGAGMDTLFDWFARLLNTCFRIYGGPSLLFGFLLMAYTAWEAWRDGQFARAEE
jgi:hypothetical protein